MMDDFETIRKELFLNKITATLIATTMSSLKERMEELYLPEGTSFYVDQWLKKNREEKDYRYVFIQLNDGGSEAWHPIVSVVGFPSADLVTSWFNAIEDNLKTVGFQNLATKIASTSAHLPHLPDKLKGSLTFLSPVERRVILGIGQMKTIEDLLSKLDVFYKRTQESEDFLKIIDNAICTLYRVWLMSRIDSLTYTPANVRSAIEVTQEKLLKEIDREELSGVKKELDSIIYQVRGRTIFKPTEIEKQLRLLRKAYIAKGQKKKLIGNLSGRARLVRQIDE